MTSVLVSATRGDLNQFYLNTLLGRSLKQHQHQDWQCAITANNSAPLADAYNGAISQSDSQSLILFCHDDVWLGEINLIPILQAALNQYDVVGVAGNRRYQQGQIAWGVDPTTNRRDNDHLVGEIEHGTPENKTNSCYGPTPASASLLDGVFLATRVSTLIDAGLAFDSQFPFHFYDLDFCLSCLNAGLSLGVWPLQIIHASGGEAGSMTWQESSKIFFNKWYSESQVENSAHLFKSPDRSTAPIMISSPANDSSQQQELKIKFSDSCIEWLNRSCISFLVSTYQIGKILTIGHQPDGRFSVFERTFDRCMGMCLTHDKNGFYLSCKNQIWRFENTLAEGKSVGGHDKLYLPQTSSITGECDIHDMVVNDDNQLIFVNTLFNCLATASHTHSFRPYWIPPFVDELVPQDRCHLNGLAKRDGKPAYVTAASCSNEADGWRQCRQNGGVVIDIESNSVIARGLSMPHSPRWYRDNLWICNAGTGEFGTIDLHSGLFQAVTFCPGFMRGLDFYDNYAIIGLSKPRDNRSFNDLALNTSLIKRNQQSICGIIVVNLDSGLVEHSITFGGLIHEIYDIISIQNCRNPMLIGLKGDEINHTITIEP